MPTHHALTLRGLRCLVSGAAAAVLLVPGIAQAAPVTQQQNPMQGMSSVCQTAITADLTKLFADFTAPPPGTSPSLTQLVATLQADLAAGKLSPDQFVSSLQALAALASAPPTGQSAIPADLQKLAADLQACAPPPPSPPAPQGGTSTGNASAQQQPVAQQQAPAPAPVVQPQPQYQQPVTYLAYAPTGGVAPASDQQQSGVPLSAVAGGVLLLAGSGVGLARVRSRTARRDR